MLYSLFIFWLLSNGFLHYEVAKNWEISPTPYANFERNYDVAIVLGGVSGFDSNYNMLEFNASSDRILHAIKLYQQGVVKKILISGGTGLISGLDVRESPNLRRYLIDIGINKDDIIIEKESRNTIENAKYSAVILNRDFENGKFLLVTSALHMKRALLCFEKQDINVIPFSCDFSMSERKFDFEHLFLPDAEILERWETLIHEWVGYVVYKIVF